MVKTLLVQGSSQVYSVKLAEDGSAVCYQPDGQLCPGWKNSKGSPKTCKHVKLALAGKTVGGSAPQALPQAEAVSSNVVQFPAAPNAKSFVQPMLASKMESAVITDWTDWAVEEKFDGHRAMVMVVNSEVTAWSRSGKRRDLPSHVRSYFAGVPNGIYDGELMGKENGTFADVRRLETQREAYFVVFDCVNFLGDNIQSKPYDFRRALIRSVFEAGNYPVRLAQSSDLRSETDVVRFVEAVWERGGEGAILKRKAAPYQPGKRSADFVKVKKGGSRLVRVTGFEAGERGPHSSVTCVDPTDGMETSVKNESKINAGPKDIGRMLWIDYTEKTAVAFVNPHCDRWEDQ